MDDVKLTENALKVLESRYLLRDEKGKVVESPSRLFKRVSSFVARAEKRYRSRYTPDEVEEHFYGMMEALEFLPNSPTLMNAGTPLGQLAACFVLPIGDSIESIFTALRHMALIQKSGGGTGFNFSHIRPKDDIVSTTGGTASGPVPFLTLFDRTSDVIVQGGKRRGANMGILRCDHPDIVDFIEAKTIDGRLSNFNLSVAVTDRFMHAVQSGGRIDLRNPRNGAVANTVKARDLFDRIAKSAWLTGDPGLPFIDEINRNNPTPELGILESTNPCGELPLLPYESCTLGSINLSFMTNSKGIDREKLGDRIRWAVRFLDDVVEMNAYPLDAIDSVTKGNRKIGLGVMGFADMLVKLNIPYDSEKATALAGELMAYIRHESLKASETLAAERSAFPNYERSVHYRERRPMRNATVNTIAPTGSIGIIAGCSSGIEPIFAVRYSRDVLSGARLTEVHPLFLKIGSERGFLNDGMLARLRRTGSIGGIDGIPEEIKNIFETAFDVAPLRHLKIQAAFQRSTDNAVSKTVNLPESASPEDIGEIYRLAFEMHCKGITVYRYGSRKGQVLTFDGNG